MKLSEKMLPGPLFRWIMENTIYGHFVPGETHEDVARSFERYRDAGVRYFPAASVEDELNEEEEYSADVSVFLYIICQLRSVTVFCVVRLRWMKMRQ